jgi:hypothetical protein
LILFLFFRKVIGKATKIGKTATNKKSLKSGVFALEGGGQPLLSPSLNRPFAVLKKQVR